MSQSPEGEGSTDSDVAAPVVSDYVLDVRILEVTEVDDAASYRFEAPQHCSKGFPDLETAELYADVYFDTNGFQEAGTGDFGVPIQVVAGGKDTLAAYMLTLPGADETWVGSFFGYTPTKIADYADRVRGRADEIRTRAAERASE